MVDIDRFDEALDRFWDDLTASNEPDTNDLDSETIALVRRMQALAAVPIPTSARERVRSHLNLTSAESTNTKEFSMSTTLELLHPIPLVPNGHRRVFPRPVPRAHLAPAVYHRLAFAISMALILAAVGVIFRSALPWSTDQNGPDGIPAAIAPATPSPAATPSIEGTFDVDGHTMFISCTGAGSPTLVFLNEMDKASVSWGDIPSAFSSDHRVCVYDRAGVGKSQKMTAHNASQSVEDLHGLLAAANVPGPYLLVGSNIGSLIATMYAGTYPTDVAGLVLVRPIHPWESELEAMLPQGVRLSVTDMNQMNQEQINYYASLPEELALLPSVGDIPVVVIAGDNIAPPVGMANPDQLVAKTYEEYQRFADSFTQGTLIKVPSSAYVLHDAPDQVIAEIQKVLDGLKSN